MSENLAKAMANKRSDKHEENGIHPDEQKALNKLRAEAEKSGATLATGGKGGLNPSLVLGVMRRDKFECKRCGSKKNLGVHHKGHLENPSSKWLKDKGHQNTPNNLVTICEGEGGCHDDIHEEDREKTEEKKND